MPKPVVIVGAGLGGLMVARRLNAAGIPFLLIDADDRPGGRLKTDVQDGFRMDRGFQVLFTGYPSARKELDFGKLDLRRYIMGAYVFDGRKMHGLQFDRDDLSLLLFNRFVSWPDKFRLGALGKEVDELSWDDLAHQEEEPTETYLRRFGFSEGFLERFLRPFFGGVFADPRLEVTSRQFLWVWKTLCEGETVTPALGMEEIPRQLAAGLPAASLRMRTRVAGLVRAGEEVTGVRLADGTVIEAGEVVVATEAPEAARLSERPTVVGAKGSICLYFEVPSSVVACPYLVLNGSGKGLVNHVAPLSNVSDKLAPAGRHLVSVTAFAGWERSDDSLALAARNELQAWFPKQNTREWRFLRAYRIPYAQMPQPVGVFGNLPANESGVPGLSFAGEFTTNSSIEGAIRSGVSCGDALVRKLAPAMV
ncbi:MAG: FAD-dependent oxidoreductase [Fimbriimonadaceae bacterium]|nr:FAD-dependent oxidoreductase [Fimbriimonadaceae bacterium]